MKNIRVRLNLGIGGLLILVLSSFGLQAQFVDFTDNTLKNRFLGVDMSMCKTQSQGSSKAYDCGNDTISGLLNINFLSPELLGQQFYIFNNFIYWMNDRNGMGAWNGQDAAAAKKEATANAQPDKYFSGTGVFMINLGTSSYLQKIVAPAKTCPTGQTLLAAQLKYNNGSTLVTWSQDSICLSPTDTFTIAVSKEQDNTVPAATAISATPAPDGQGVDWMQDAGPSDNYGQAGDSPRKMRLVLKSGGAQALQVAQPAQAAKVAIPLLNNTIIAKK